MHGYILIVDDEEDFRALLAEDLIGLGYEVRQAENGKVALERLEEELPALVLLDLKMPVMSGWAVLEALKQMPRAREVPVLVISAYGFEWEAELVGAAGYINKPVEPSLLRQKIEALLPKQEEAVIH